MSPNQMKKIFLLFAMVLIGMAFATSLAALFLIGGSPHALTLAEDNVKTILGFIIGTLTGIFASGK